MKITLCGSMNFAREMLKVKSLMEKKGHTIYAPKQIIEYSEGRIRNTKAEDAENKIKHNLIKDHYDKIMASDAILVLNYDKKGMRNYIGGNTFLEIGFAHVLGRKIFLLNDVPDMEIHGQEIIACRPTIINGNLEMIK